MYVKEELLESLHLFYPLLDGSVTLAYPLLIHTCKFEWRN